MGKHLFPRKPLPGKEFGFRIEICREHPPPPQWTLSVSTCLQTSTCNHVPLAKHPRIHRGWGPHPAARTLRPRRKECVGGRETSLPEPLSVTPGRLPRPDPRCLSSTQRRPALPVSSAALHLSSHSAPRVRHCGAGFLWWPNKHPWIWGPAGSPTQSSWRLQGLFQSRN